VGAVIVAALIFDLLPAGDSVVKVEGDAAEGDSSDKGRPSSNEAQNKQARDAIREYEQKSGKKLNKDQVREAHEEFQRHPNPGYHDLIDILKDTFGD
jgi:hypothetical protein